MTKGSYMAPSYGPLQGDPLYAPYELRAELQNPLKEARDHIKGLGGQAARVYGLPA